MRHGERIHTLVRALVAMVATALLTACVDVGDGVQLADEEVRYALPTAEFRDVELRHTEAGELTFHLEAPRFDRYDHDEHDQRAVFYGGVTIHFYKDGRVSSTLTSDSGEVLRGGDELLALGHVVVDTDTGTTILTPRLRWTAEDKLITSDTTVTIITERDTLRGTGLIATDDLRMRRVLNPVGVSHRTQGQGSGGIRLSPDRRDTSVVPPTAPLILDGDTLRSPPDPPSPTPEQFGLNLNDRDTSSARPVLACKRGLARDGLTAVFRPVLACKRGLADNRMTTGLMPVLACKRGLVQGQSASVIQGRGVSELGLSLFSVGVLADTYLLRIPACKQARAWWSISSGEARA